jgi:hypothetical protein
MNGRANPSPATPSQNDVCKAPAIFLLLRRYSGVHQYSPAGYRFCGRKAQQAQRYLRIPLRVTVFNTFHPGAQAYNHLARRDHLQDTFAAAARLIGR